jgi:hypothetical protein
MSPEVVSTLFLSGLAILVAAAMAFAFVAVVVAFWVILGKF